MAILIVGLNWMPTGAGVFGPVAVLTGAETLELLSRAEYDAVVVGPHIPATTVDALVAQIQERHMGLPVVLVGEAGGAATRQSVWEHVGEPDRLSAAMRRAVYVGMLRRLVHSARGTTPAAGRDEVTARVFRAGSIREMERLMILARLESFDQNRTRSARSLQISVRTLRNKLRAYRRSPAPEFALVEEY